MLHSLQYAGVSTESKEAVPIPVASLGLLVDSDPFPWCHVSASRHDPFNPGVSTETKISPLPVPLCKETATQPHSANSQLLFLTASGLQTQFHVGGFYTLSDPTTSWRCSLASNPGHSFHMLTQRKKLPGFTSMILASYSLQPLFQHLLSQ